VVVFRTGHEITRAPPAVLSVMVGDGDRVQPRVRHHIVQHHRRAHHPVACGGMDVQIGKPHDFCIRSEMEKVMAKR